MTDHRTTGDALADQAKRYDAGRTHRRVSKARRGLRRAIEAADEADDAPSVFPLRRAVDVLEGWLNEQEGG